MQFINALSISPNVRRWLANSHHPRILHVFDQACNLINERRDILSVVTSQIGNGPFNLVIETDFCFSKHLGLESPVNVSRTQLNLGELNINVGNAKLWLPRPDWESLHVRRDDIFNQLMSLRGRWPSTRSNPRINWEIASSQSALLATTLITNYQSPISNSLISALANADLPNCIAPAKQLAGLGQGLTPAGDDFILGALLAVWIIHPPEIASFLAKEISNTAAPLTTSLSAAWLRSAGRGEAGIVWHHFFHELVVENDIQLPITKLLSIGETSGADALAGFVGLFRSWVGNTSSISSRSLDKTERIF